MNPRRALFFLAACLATMAPLLPATAAASPGPAWALTLTPMPAAYTPGSTGELLAVATDVGAQPTSGELKVAVSLPVGLTATSAEATDGDPASLSFTCEVPTTQIATCKTSDSLGAARWILVKVLVTASSAETTYAAQASVEGGGAGTASSAATSIAVQASPPVFGILPGFSAPLDEEDGAATPLAGSHPYQQTVSFGFPTEVPEAGLTNAGHPRDFTVALPRGLIGDPAASQALCTEAQLLANACPRSSQVGLTDITTVVAVTGANGVATSALYNMVPPPGAPAELATNIANVGIFSHVMAEVRSGSDYGIDTFVRDALAFSQEPIFNVQAQVWGDPSATAHDHVRSTCLSTGAPCPDPAPSTTALLTTPGDCSGNSLAYGISARSWEKPGLWHEASYESSDLAGDQVRMEGCGELQFEPTINARPDTPKAESAAGFDFTLTQPQQKAHINPLTGRATAILQDATITFPVGLQVNPSQAAGLKACSEAQVGYEGQGIGSQRFSGNPQSCPDAAKLGTVVATTPLLPQRNEAQEVEQDGEGNPLAEPLHGSIYLATPYQNPFGSLIAVYLTVEDKARGIVAKLAGEGSLDPETGRIRTSFTESPELPLEEVHVHLFGGDRGAFITPPSCGEYGTGADLTPWSAPEGLSVHSSDTFTVSEGPGGGPCLSAQPNAPKLEAGTLRPVAGKYSPLVFKLSREDGSERIAKVEASLPPGLTARLAGVSQCPSADIKRAISREAPNMGATEITAPSCPASSEVGTVDAAAGAGPRPFHIKGHAYLAGPYKGAPLSFVIVTPAVAGPFDLGTVVVRTAVYLDLETAQPRAVSDPLPQLIEGVPADVRSIELRLDRPSFTLNPTSCDEESFNGSAISVLGHIAPLSERFQVGGCRHLSFKPKLSLRLYGKTHRGAHPRLRAVLQAKPGEAGIARTVVALPRSEFIDQAHFRTICTRVQFAAKACPKGSVYGHIRAITPLLDYPLQGPIYLRSSSHVLPDVVAALRGPVSQPIEVDLDGRVDSVGGGVRTTFAAIPDAPVTKAIITLQGKSKGLFQNSTDICKGSHRATVNMDGQNGKTHDMRPLLRASCSKERASHHRLRG